MVDAGLLRARPSLRVRALQWHAHPRSNACSNVVCGSEPSLRGARWCLFSGHIRDTSGTHCGEQASVPMRYCAITRDFSMPEAGLEPATRGL
jgi:hypothetical protein